jgi:alkylation response protein AidB-like acyl-CoA dehydrogenase
VTSPLISRRDLDFVLYQLLDVEAFTRQPRWSEHRRETFDAAIETAHALALEQFRPHNAKADQHEPHFDGERVHIIPEVKIALDAYIAAGFMAASKDYELGGMQLPWTVAQACSAMFQAANVGTTAYPFLTIAAANLIEAFGSPAMQERFMRPMLAGRFFGTMCLSEPQAGSSLADIRTRAEPASDGTYRIFGSKMWISAGDHELAENIVHLVLAKIPGGPAGVKGISLFIVPKVLVGVDGALGARNDVRLAGVNHKMGYRGAINTVLSFGEQGGAVGHLVGEPHRGLEYMFHMMNEARIGVGMGAVMLAYAAYLAALDYVRTRPQGRPPDGRDPTQPMVPIIEHADVKRMLLYQKAISEGGLHLALYAASLVDRLAATADAAERSRLTLLLDTLTPIVKGWLSQAALRANDYAIQVLGGYGYTREYPVEQYYRDQRLNPIHEGTDGIQAIDLLGRKMTIRDGAGWRLLVEEIDATIARARPHTGLSAYAEELQQSVVTVDRVRQRLLATMGAGQVALGLANASYFLDLAGLVVSGWMWLWQALRVTESAAGSDPTADAFAAGKLQTCRYVFTYELARVPSLAALLERVDDTTLGMRADWF